MGTYLMFGSYNSDSLKEISPERTDEAEEIIQENGGLLKVGYAMLGEYDLVLIVSFPDDSTAIKTSAELSRLLGISFSTSPAINIEELDYQFFFDKLEDDFLEDEI